MKRPVRVLYVLNSAGGGATQGILELLAGLPEDRYRAYAVIPSAPNDFQRENLRRLTRSFRIVPMSWWNRRANLSLWNRAFVWGAAQLRTLGRLRPVLQLASLIKEWEIDIVYSNTAMMLDGALAARITRRPHLWHLKEWVGESARTRFIFPDPMLARFFTYMSERVLVMSRFIGELFERYGLNDRVALITDGVDTKRFTGDLKGHKFRQGLGVSEGEILVGMVASLSSTWKRHALFIEMSARLASQFPRARFVIFGPEPKRHGSSIYNQGRAYYEGLKQQAHRSSLNGRFIWGGFHQDIPQMMDAIDILVHPCDIEPFGRIAIEAMAAGRPVVGPDRGGISESIADGETGLLVKSGDVDAFASATARLISSDSLRRQLGDGGRKRAITCFSLEQHVKHVSELYDEILSLRRR